MRLLRFRTLSPFIPVNINIQLSLQSDRPCTVIRKQNFTALWMYFFPVIPSALHSIFKKSDDSALLEGHPIQER